MYTSATSSAPLPVLCLVCVSSSPGSRSGWAGSGGGGIGVGFPRSLLGSVVSEAWREAVRDVTVFRELDLFLPGSSGDTTLLSGVDLLRLAAGDEPETTIVPCPPVAVGSVDCPFPLSVRYSQFKLLFVQVLHGLSPLHCVVVSSAAIKSDASKGDYKVQRESRVVRTLGLDTRSRAKPITTMF